VEAETARIDALEQHDTRTDARAFCGGERHRGRLGVARVARLREQVVERRERLLIEWIERWLQGRRHAARC